jgi:hypothetical protein
VTAASSLAATTVTSPRVAALRVVMAMFLAKLSPTASVAPASVALAADTRYTPRVVASNLATARPS